MGYPLKEAVWLYFNQNLNLGQNQGNTEKKEKEIDHVTG